MDVQLIQMVIWLRERGWKYKNTKLKRGWFKGETRARHMTEAIEMERAAIRAARKALKAMG